MILIQFRLRCFGTWSRHGASSEGKLLKGIDAFSRDWPGESKIQSFDLDGVPVDSIPAIPPTQITCLVDHSMKLE
jgi:hypothetical protein